MHSCLFIYFSCLFIYLSFPLKIKYIPISDLYIIILNDHTTSYETILSANIYLYL